MTNVNAILREISQQSRFLVISALVAFGSILFGYDNGVTGAALVLPSFDVRFGLVGSPLEIAHVASNVVSFLTAGSLAAAPLSSIISLYLGRRPAMAIGALCLVIGACVQTAATTVHMMYAGRFVSGLGVGTSMQICPMYIGECAAPKFRAAAITMVFVMMNVGSVLAYWIGFGVSKHVSNASDSQWRILIGFQIVLGGVFALGLFFIPESPRHLAWCQLQEERALRKQGLPVPRRFADSPARKPDVDRDRDVKEEEPASGLAYDSATSSVEDDAAQVTFYPTVASYAVGGAKASRNASPAIRTLSYIRQLPPTSDVIKSEMSEIYAQIDELNAARDKESVWMALKKKSTIKRFALAVFCGTWSTWSGIAALLYYAANVFQSLGLSSTSVSLLAGGVYGIVSLVFACVAFLWGINHYGRISGATVGGGIMGCLFFAIGAILATHPVNPLAPTVSSSSVVLVVLIYLIGVINVLTLGPIMYIYASEIFPIGLREAGQAVYMMITWMNAFLGAKYIEIGFAQVGWRFWFLFGSINVVGVAIFIWCPETKDKSIEEIDVLFGGVDSEERDAHVKEVLQAGRVLENPTSA